MDYIVPVSEARAKLPALLKKIHSFGKHLVLTKNGRAQAVVISPEELETLEIKASSVLMRSLIRAQEDIKAGKLYSHADVFKNV